MSTSLGKLLATVAVVALFHATDLTDLSTLKALGRPAGALPTSIVIEAFVALGLFLPAVALSTPPLEDVTYRGELAKRSPDDADARMGFARLSARGRALFGDAVSS
ncbi:hypothetical protein Q8F55_004330 [Vanrija albida]|uniref:Uncharacterized protein n=1 Tax=Vanrija albida TaxID=181172 RepID=A0ABR3Q6N0_9TREE